MTSYLYDYTVIGIVTALLPTQWWIVHVLSNENMWRVAIQVQDN